jgi:AAA15 family ATPase/GTPase
MLIEFRIGNFRSFDEPQTLSLVASSDTKHPDNCIPFGRLQLLKSAALYGANASGKSNLIKAIDFMWRIVLQSATAMNVGDEIRVVPFQLNPDSRGKASFFEAAFVVDEVRYHYGFTVTSKRVQDEWLIAYPKGRAQHLLERRFDVETEQTTWAFRGELHKEGTLLRERTRDNGLVLSRGAELNVAPLTTVFLWFRQQMLVLDLSTPPALLINQTAVRLKEDAAFRERILRFIRHADLGISGLEVSEGNHKYALHTIQSVHQSLGGEVVRFNFQEAESNGTQRFFALAGLWLEALDRGGLLVVDELDCSMHPSLTRKLVELFQTRDANPHGAQLVFSTHNSTLLDLELFRRDQIWIVEKDRAGASRLSSLYDFEERPRNNEALQRRYLAGHYGGVPVFGPTFEDLELK